MKKAPFDGGFENRLAANFKNKLTRFLEFLQDFFHGLGPVGRERLEHFCDKVREDKDGPQS